MTEQDPSNGQLNQIDLTSQHNLSTLEERGNIFMQDGTPVGPEQNQPPVQEPQRAPENTGEQAGGETRRGRTIENFYSELQSRFDKPEIVTQLTSATPDFSNLPDIKDYIDSLDPTEKEMIHFVDYITSLHPKFFHRDADGNDTPVQISNEAKKLIFEWTLEKIIGLPEKGSLEARYQIDSFQARDNLTSLKSLSVSNFKTNSDFARYVGEMIEVREMAHELRRNLTQGDTYKKFIQEGLRTHGLDFMRNEVAGVSYVDSLYELLAGLKVAEKGEWLTEGDVRAIDEDVKKAIEGSKGFLEKHGRILTDWETERALAMGKTYFAGTQRFAMYSSLGKVSAETAARVGSRPYEFIVRTLVPVKVTAVRYFTDGGPRAYMEKVIDELEEVNTDKKTGEVKGTLFGIGQEAWLVNGLGAVDAQSHPWRSQLMFLGDIEITDFDETGQPIAGSKITLLDFFNRRLEAIKRSNDFGNYIDFSDATGFMIKGNEKKKHEIIDKFQEVFSNNEQIASSFLGQRLYLSVLSRYDQINSDLRQGIFRKMAILDPLKIAALKPDILYSEGFTDQDRILWADMRQKLLVANMRRLKEDGKLYFDENGKRKTQTMDSLRAEAGKLLTFDGQGRATLKNTISEVDKYEIIEKYFSQGELSEAEIIVLKKVINKGIASSRYLAGSKQDFTYIINDAPHVAWAKTGTGIGGLGDENLFRILLSDQEHLVKAYTEINGLVENPAQGSTDHFIKAVENISLVMGRVTAQGKVRPFIKAWIEMASTNGGDLWFGGFKKLFNHPTSEMMKYFKSSFISMDEAERAEFLTVLAHAGAISDDKSVPGPTQLELLKKELNAGIMANNLRIARIFLLLLGPALGTEFIKIMFPGDVVKALGMK